MPRPSRTSLGRPVLPVRFEPEPRQVDDLIARAAEHPLGTDYLVEGWLDSVSATFQVHAFTVEQARERLRRLPGQDV